MPTQFDDLEIEVSRCSCGKPEVRILGSAFNRPREHFAVPFDLQQLTQLLDELDELLLETNESKLAGRRKDLAQELGKSLFSALLPGDVGETFSRSMASVQASRQAGLDVGQRIRISFGEAEDYPPEVVSLPWELLCNPQTLEFHGNEQPTPIVRYLDAPTKIKPLQVAPPLRVLAILCSPRSTATERLSPIDKPRHKKILQKAEDDQSRLKVHFLDPPTLDNIRKTLSRFKKLRKPFHALHFFGHGKFNDKGEGVLYFEDRDGNAVQVTGQDLKSQLTGFEEMSLAVLATCVGAQMMRRNGQHPFTGAASALVTKLPAVVAMQFTISEKAATHFTSSFYEYIANGHPVDESVSEGRLSIAANDSGSFEWACPVLFMRSPDGKILDIKPEAELEPRQISIFNIKDHAKKNIDINEREVDLRDFFVLPTDREGLSRPQIRRNEDWNAGVMSALIRVFNRELTQEANYRMTIAAPISVAFAAGFLMHTRNAGQLIFPQRGQLGVSDWIFEGEVPSHAQRWLPMEKTHQEIPETLPKDDAVDDITVVVELSRPMMPAVSSYLERPGNAPRVGRVLYARLDAGPGHSRVENGAHAFRLAESLCNLVYEHSSATPKATIHWFISGPNAFNFALGRMARCFPKSQLYEFDFGGQGDGSGSYSPSITLPPEPSRTP